MLVSSFFLALTALFFQAILVPKVAILAFSPFIALVVMRCNLVQSIVLSIIAGSCMDLFSNDPMGIHAIEYALIATLAFRFKRHFLHDQPLHLSLFTALISSLSTLLCFLLLFLFDRRVPFSGRWFFATLIGMPVLDALYAFVWFSAPITGFQTLRKIWVVFWLKRKNRSLISH